MDELKQIPGMSLAQSIKYFLGAECNACRFLRSMIELALIASNTLLAVAIFLYMAMQP